MGKQKEKSVSLEQLYDGLFLLVLNIGYGHL